MSKDGTKKKRIYSLQLQVGVLPASNPFDGLSIFYEMLLLSTRFKTLQLLAFVAIATLSRVTSVAGADSDIGVYINDALSTGWQNWSWNTDVNFAATDIVAGSSGTSASIRSDAWSALSLKLDTNFSGYAGLRFDIAGSQPEIQIYFDSTTESITSPSIPLSAISKTVTSDKFSTLTIDFNSLPGTDGQLGAGKWDRVSIQAQANGASYHLDNVVIVKELVVTPLFLSAEPLTNSIVAVTTQGKVSLSNVQVTLNGKSVSIVGNTSYVPVDTPAKSITYFNLATPFTAGSLAIRAGNTTFSYTLPSASGVSVNQGVSTYINPLIYGVNFPTSAAYIQHLGVTNSRWGGNAVTAYNPFGGFTNAGADWFFENRGTDSADDWVGWVKGAGSAALVTIPALDWVAKDTSSYSYPKTVYPDQQKFDPYKPDAGNGARSDGTPVNPPADPTRAYTPWNTTLAKKWLAGLKNKPDILAIDNEIEIVHATHQDMHPNPLTYAEELSRVVSFSKAAKEVYPDVAVAAPSTCAWWFYWTSAVGWSDTQAHGNVDFLPWFLGEMKKAEKTAGRRLLDYLDIHYYFQADTSANTDQNKALRLRATRSFWDPTYVDESWVGTGPQENHQPNPNNINLIPRFKTMINNIYPGTKLSISEWSSTEADISGGLVVVDSLGIFGKYGLDSAQYWATPNELSPVGLAYWLYRGYGTYFGSRSAQVTLTNPNPNIFGVYAGTQNNKVTLVIVNKDPKAVQSFALTGVPTGSYFIRHFGGAAGLAKWQTTISLKSASYIAVPAYTAVFLQQK
ncbi:glycoside hydrolase family 44-domain-containing protein [Panaeolus papilionaceus]|nr:glycoside hydrolase family 44-domain-containing protein [Panaeolus papilionaceus]